MNTQGTIFGLGPFELSHHRLALRNGSLDIVDGPGRVDRERLEQRIRLTRFDNTKAGRGRNRGGSGDVEGEFPLGVGNVGCQNSARGARSGADEQGLLGKENERNLGVGIGNVNAEVEYVVVVDIPVQASADRLFGSSDDAFWCDYQFQFPAHPDLFEDFVNVPTAF